MILHVKKTTKPAVRSMTEFMKVFCDFLVFEVTSLRLFHKVFFGPKILFDFGGFCGFFRSFFEACFNDF